MATSDGGIHRIAEVESPTSWGPCGHPNAAKLLQGQGEYRTPTTTTYEPEPGVVLPVTYYAPDAPVTALAWTVCAECGGCEVWEIPTTPVIEEPPALPPPPPPVLDVTDCTVQPAPEEASA